jgi:hypothetical protein
MEEILQRKCIIDKQDEDGDFTAEGRVGPKKL